jgi:hypothetical protein
MSNPSADEPVPDGFADGLRLGVDVELAVDVADVAADGVD